MEDKRVKGKVSIFNLKTKEEIKIPLILSLQTIEMLVEDALKSDLTILIEPIIN